MCRKAANIVTIMTTTLKYTAPSHNYPSPSVCMGFLGDLATLAIFLKYSGLTEGTVLRKVMLSDIRNFPSTLSTIIFFNIWMEELVSFEFTQYTRPHSTLRSSRSMFSITQIVSKIKFCIYTSLTYCVFFF